MRVTTVNRLMRLPGTSVIDVSFAAEGCQRLKPTPAVIADPFIQRAARDPDQPAITPNMLAVTSARTSRPRSASRAPGRQRPGSTHTGTARPPGDGPRPLVLPTLDTTSASRSQLTAPAGRGNSCRTTTGRPRPPRRSATSMGPNRSTHAHAARRGRAPARRRAAREPRWCRRGSARWLRKGQANTQRGVVRFAQELIADVKRAGATGEKLFQSRLGLLKSQADRQARERRLALIDQCPHAVTTSA